MGERARPRSAGDGLFGVPTISRTITDAVPRRRGVSLPSGKPSLAGRFVAAIALAVGGAIAPVAAGPAAAAVVPPAQVQTSQVPALPANPATATLVVSGNYMSCAIVEDSTVKCWGNNTLGQLGNGTTTDSSTPVVVSGLSGVIGLAAGQNHVCALISGGTIKCWGDNSYKQLGADNPSSYSTTPITSTDLTGVTAIAAGDNHTCALVAGAVKCWGSDSHMELGDGGTTATATPVTVNLGGATAVALASGQGHNCALLNDATVKCWGWNNHGQLGNGTLVDSPTPVGPTFGQNVVAITAGASHTCAILADNKVWCWGYNFYGQLGDNSTSDRSSPVNVVIMPGSVAISAASISAGDGFSCAVLVGGGVDCWGVNHSGQLGNTTTIDRPYAVAVSLTNPAVSSISSGGSHTCALYGDGSVWCWGANWDGELGNGTEVFVTSPVGVLGLTGLTATYVSAGGYHTCALFSNGSIECWGANWYGQLGNNSVKDSSEPVVVSLSGATATAVAAGEYHTCAIITGGTVKCWGYNNVGQLGNNTTTDSWIPVSVDLGVGAVATAISAGDEFTCALLSDHTVKCWGYNVYGQLGNNSTADSHIPVAVNSLTTATSITLGGFHACSLVTGGGVVCWGANWDAQLAQGYGQYGTPNTTDSHVPVAVLDPDSTWSDPLLLDDATEVVAGTYGTCALSTADGTICWGSDGRGQLGDNMGATDLLAALPVSPAPLTGATSVAAGGWHNCAIVAGGAAKCWGYNNDGQIGDGTTTNRPTPASVLTLTGAAQLSGGKNHTCALITGGTLECWGYNSYGQLGDGRTLYSSTPVEVLRLGSPPGPPTGVYGTYGNASVQVTWAAPAANGGWPITGYTVTSTPASTGCTTTGALTCQVTGLANGTSYTFQVTATNTIGEGAPSDASTGVVPRATPGAPSNVTAVAHAQSVAVSWDAAANNGANITDYYAVPYIGSTVSGTACHWTTGPLTCTVTGLTNGQAYTFEVYAHNSEGDGPLSAPSSPATPVDVPAKPGPPTAVAGVASATVSWTAPADNGSAITGYTVTSTPGSKQCTWHTGDGALQCTVTGLTNGTPYTFTVHATNGIGSSLESNASNSVTPSAAPTVPGAPTGVSAAAGDTTATVSWTAPASNGGSAITGYTVTSTPGSKHCYWTSGALSCQVTGLTNGTPYTFKVYAHNALGDGIESGASSSVIPAGLPGKPTGVTAAAAGSTSVKVTWTAPSANGSAITDYWVTSTPGSKQCHWTTGLLSCTVSGLTPGTPYTFKVAATNAVGAGPASDASNTVTLAAPVTKSTYHPITPVRLLDTRSGNGLTGKLLANTPRTFQITGRLGIPAGVSAVTGNVTVVGSTAGWAVYLGPTPIASPTTSAINFTAGQVAGNGLTVALSSTGSLSATYISTGGNTTDLVFDVTGYFTPDASGATYHPMNPVRELDTRVGNGLTGKLKASTPRSFVVAGRNGVPTNAKAVTGNVTVVGSSASWALYLGPVSLTSPTTSVVNFNAGQVAGNNLTVALSPTGTLYATYMGPAGATTDLVFDVTGYYTADATGSSFVAITPARVLDTRTAGAAGKISANTPRTFAVWGVGGVPSSAAGGTGNVTVVNETAGWAVFLGPTAIAAPTTSTINFSLGDVKGNGLTVALSATGTLSATYMSTSGNKTDLVFDVTGYFVP